MRHAARLVIYGLLLAGAAAFALPFLWMASTSVKVDREVQTRDFRLLPSAPRPRDRSPYVDDRFYADLEGPHQAALLGHLEALIGPTGFEPPPFVDAAEARRQTARGLYERLRRRLPRHLWDGRTEAGEPVGDAAAAVAALAEAARAEVTREMVEEVFGNVYRRLTLGPVRLRSYDRVEVELGAGAPVAGRFDNRTPETLAVAEVAEKGGAVALARYDFGRGDRFVLAQTFEVPERFDLGRLHRIFLDVRPDDTWHELRVEVEAGGVRWRSARPWPLANFDVAQAQWQPPGPDDHSTKIRTWVSLEESARGGEVLADPGRLRLVLEVRRVGTLGAWWSKLRRNYYRVLDHMPFWRYLRVSLLLVIANVVLAVGVSSLVAYAFARLSWPGRDLGFLLMLATMMIPFQVTMIPQFLIWKHLGAYDTLVPLWLGPAFGSAFYIFLLRQFLKGVPRDLEDAARLDGCGFLRIYWHIMLPLIKPSLAAIAIFTFLATWNNFMGPLIYIADQRLYPLAFGLYAFSVQVGNDPALTMAASFLMTVPVIVVFFFAQKYFIQGITLTGIKG